MTVSLSYPEPAFEDGPMLRIRPAKGIDAPAVAELRAQCSQGTSASPAFTAAMRTWLEAEGEPRVTLTAAVNGDVVGVISMLEHRGMPEPGAAYARWGYIGHLFVRADQRRQGIGAALIGEVIRIADSRHYAKLMVSPGNMGLSLFHRLGFLMTDEIGPEGILLLRLHPDSAGA